MSKPRVLVIDDGYTYAQLIAEQMPEFELVCPDPNSEVPCIQDGPRALKFLATSKEQVDVVLLDMRFDLPPEQLLPLEPDSGLRKTRRFQGVAILREIRALYPELPVVLLTAVEDLSLVDAAEELTSQSMTYFLGRDDLDALRIRIYFALRETGPDLEESGILWGKDPAMRAIRQRLLVLARGRMPVILEGDTGTGKSFLAETFLHPKSEREGPFVVLDLASVPQGLIPAHLFGATRGSYTGAVTDRKGVFELAHRGTLFIDEVQNVPLEVQKQLLLVLQDRRVRPLGSVREIEVDVKVVAATSSGLDVEVANGRFRSDLYMRLSPATRVRIPPLSERPSDLTFLIRRFAQRAVADQDIRVLVDLVAQAVGLGQDALVNLVFGKGSAGESRHGDQLEIVLPEPAWRMLETHRWPGNIRELAMVVYNLLTFTLVAAVDALKNQVPLSTPRLQIDPGLVGELLSGSAALGKASPCGTAGASHDEDLIPVRLEPGESLNAVANSVERQYFLTLFKQTRGDFREMANRLVGDPGKSRAVRLRFNQLGLKVRELTRS